MKKSLFFTAFTFVSILCFSGMPSSTQNYSTPRGTCQTDENQPTCLAACPNCGEIYSAMVEGARGNGTLTKGICQISECRYNFETGKIEK